MIKIYGIPNCDVTQKSRAWLTGNKIGYVLHDYKKDGISVGKLKAWCGEVGWETLLNKRGTTWKGLPDATRLQVTGEQEAIRLMSEHTSLIKRPVIETGKKLLVGYNEQDYHKHIKNKK